MSKRMGFRHTPRYSPIPFLLKAAVLNGIAIPDDCLFTTFF